MIQLRPRLVLLNESIGEVDAGLLNAITGGELMRARRMAKAGDNRIRGWTTNRIP